MQFRYDPFDLSTTQVWCDGRRSDDARPYELLREHAQRVRPRDRDEVALFTTGLSYLDLLMAKHEDEARAVLHRGNPDKTPFTRAVAPATLSRFEQHQELLARLGYLVQSRGCRRSRDSPL